MIPPEKKRAEHPAGEAPGQLDRLLALVQRTTGVEIRADRRCALGTKLRRRARELGLANLAEYEALVRRSPSAESGHLLSLCTTHVTGLFRDPLQFDYLYERFFPERLDRAEPLRVWSAGCATGEEAYSVAMTFLEAVRARATFARPGGNPRCEILGTDLDPISIETARNGVYPARVAERVKEHLVERYFEHGNGELAGLIRVRDEVHGLCRFEVSSLLHPTGAECNFDLILLRNVLIYLGQDRIQEALEAVRRKLRPGGVLLLGAAEPTDGLASGFERIGPAIHRLKDGSEKAAKELTPASTSATSPVRVLLVDDSRVIRAALRQVLGRAEGFLVVGEAEDPVAATPLVAALAPDVVVLDLHMPRQTGTQYLASVRGKGHPPVVVLSSVSFKDADGALRCLELGAFDFLEKPAGWDTEEPRELLRETLRSAARWGARLSLARARAPCLPAPPPDARRLIVLGASTGGVDTIREIVQQLPADVPPFVLVQHLPAAFTAGFVERLGQIATVPVCETRHGEIVEAGTVYVARGGHQTRLVAEAGKLKLRVTEDPPVNRHRPSVDCLFESAADLPRSWKISAALLTGMGNDGALGLQRLRDAGAHTIAESEETAVVFGMPREAIALGAAREILPRSRVLEGLLAPFREPGGFVQAIPPLAVRCR